MKHLFLALLVSSCATPVVQPVEEPAVEAVPQDVSPERGFVVISRNTALYASPTDPTPLLQYRAPEMQRQRDDEMQRDMAEYLEKRQERYAKEIEREKKRIKKIKDRERRDAYIAARRESRARRHLKAMEKKALRFNEGDPASRFIALRVLGESGEFFKVENLLGDEETPHCYRRGLAGLGRARLTFFVRKDEVERVSTRRQRVEVWKGSAVEVAAGVVLKDGAVVVDGFHVDVDFPSDAVDQTYFPKDTFEAPYTDTTFSEVALAEGLLSFDRKQVFPFNPWIDAYVTATLTIGKRFYATTQTRCAAFTVHADESLLEPVGRRATMRLSAADPPATAPFARAGAELRTTRGDVIGEAVGNLALGIPSGVDNCYVRNVWPPEKGAEHRSFTWCVDPEFVSQ
ncbi:MAG: hypothetical protein R3E66_10140 [bacterium]